jgi:hypothetical protein
VGGLRHPYVLLIIAVYVMLAIGWMLIGSVRSGVAWIINLKPMRQAYASAALGRVGSTALRAAWLLRKTDWILTYYAATVFAVILLLVPFALPLGIRTLDEKCRSHLTAMLLEKGPAIRPDGEPPVSRIVRGDLIASTNRYLFLTDESRFDAHQIIRVDEVERITTRYSDFYASNRWSCLLSR